MTDLVALVGEHVALRQQGRRWVGLCPFHAEKTPSFSVNPEQGLYYCFGCRASGDAITFVRDLERLDFVEAVRLLGDRAGITVHDDDTRGDRDRRAALFDAMERATSWYHERLLSAPDAGPARDYLRSRGYDGNVVRAFRLGWAPDDWDALSSALRLSEHVLTGAGLGFVNRRGRLQDAFRARVVFPICDTAGRAVALGARVLPQPSGRREVRDPKEPGEPKYKNSQETAIYAKRRTLYALNWAKQDVVASNEVVVCEGYTDVIGFFTAGVPRAVATCGTALGEEHFKMLRNFAKRIVLAYDADAAGQSATSRVYEWERRHEVEVAVAALPSGSDPGELAQRDPDALRQAVAAARPFLQFRVDAILGAADFSTVEGRARAADAALRAVAEHPDELVRDQYVMQVADRCRLEDARVRERLAAVGRKGPGQRATRPAGSSLRREGPRPGLEALRLAVHRPEAVVDRLEEVLFVDDLQRRAFRALAESDNLHAALGAADPEVAELLRRVTVEEPLAGEDAVFDPVDDVVHQLLREATRQRLAELQAAARTSPDDLGTLAAQTAAARTWLSELEEPATAREASERLLTWLLWRGEEGR